VADIHPTAIVEPGAELGEGVSIGPYCMVGADVVLGDEVRLVSHAVVAGRTSIGPRTSIYPFASIGHPPQDTKYRGEPSRLEIGADNVIREHVTMSPGTPHGRMLTRVGNNCLFMIATHVAHDCIVGDHVVMANNASLAGHVSVGDHANIGGYSGVLQFRSVGAFTHIAAFSYVIKDVPAYVTAVGNPACAVGLNVEGMRRRAGPKAVLIALDRAYKTVYRVGLTAKEACDALEDDANRHPEVRMFVDTIRTSEHGVIRPRRGSQAT
jgi:UDP-N-acetylglucosamine acyltransferase